ncbi:MAG TPA: hypothetical protein VEK79_08230 [Thermoanaerobaculia bacterium]|nr:hypothetical protein [Thermoanaerobaculia bacterium]
MLLIHADDEFRKSLIATLDARHFTVTFAADGDRALDLLGERDFRVVIVGLNVANRALETLRETRNRTKCGVILLGDPNPELRRLAPWADETLLKPVDPAYVAQRANSYCAQD